MRISALVALAAALGSGTAFAQSTTGAQPATAQATSAPASEPHERTWSFDASVTTYVLPDARNYVQPTLAADRGWLHLEARFNYEALDTGSAWFGYTFSAGEHLTLDITPMIGAVFGDTSGIAPGYEFSLAWRALELSSEAEYVFDTNESSDSFFYTWSELSVAPAAWWRVGVVVQRTKAYQTQFDIQRGFLAGLSFRRVDVTAYLLNPDASRPTVVVGVSASF